MEERRIPSLLLNILLAQVEEMMGRRSLRMLLRQAGLAEYVDHVPPKDDSPSITIDQYSSLLANIYEIFGAKGSRPIFLRGGRLGAIEIRRQRPAQFAVAGTALKLLPSARRMQLVLDRVAEQGEDLYGSPHHLSEDDQAFFIEMPDCPYCAEITPAVPRREQADRQAGLSYSGRCRVRNDRMGDGAKAPGRRGGLHRPGRSCLSFPHQQVACPLAETQLAPLPARNCT